MLSHAVHSPVATCTSLRDCLICAMLTCSEGRMITESVREQVAKYLARARQALSAGELSLAHDDYITAINRAY